MLKHLLTVIYRNALRFKSPFIINLIGLSSGLAAALLIYLWVYDELSFDRYHENDDRLYQVMYHEKTVNDIKTTGQTPYFLANALLDDVPEIEYAVTATPPLFFPDFTIYANERYVKAVGKFVDRSFFQLFSYKLLEGRVEDVLNDKSSVVICESLARSLYNSPENAVGKEFEYSLLHLKKQLTVSGVFKDLPNNSSERFDFIVSFQIIDDLMGLRDHDYSWERTDPFFTYVLLKEGADVKSVNEKLENYIALKNGSAPFSMFLRPFSDGYLYGKYQNGHLQGGRIDYVIVFSIVAIFILAIACINFINLSTAKARTRLKEIGIKKVIGATRRSLILQFMGETLLVSLIALSIALVFVYFILPEFNLIAGKKLEYEVNYSLVVSLVGLALTTGFIAGIYPALYI
jgi:putative ABC transport system permease protein